MNKRKLIIIGSILVIAGVGGYFGYQWLKKRKEKEGASKDDSSSESGSGSSTGSIDVKTTAPVISASKFSFPASWTTNDGNKFRAWINDNYPDYAKQIQLDRTGSLNTYLDTAYQKYGKTYQDSLKSAQTKANALFKSGDIVKTKNLINTKAYRVTGGVYKSTNETIKATADGLYRIDSNPVSTNLGISYYASPLTLDLKPARPGVYYLLPEAGLKLR
jgi:hypothetical protein